MLKPFEHLIVDFVGPLPCSKSGSNYLFTVCLNTHFPAAYSLRTVELHRILLSVFQESGKVAEPPKILAPHVLGFKN